MQHPYLHPIEQVEFLVDHQLLVMVQPFVPSGSLKDLIYKVASYICVHNVYSKRIQYSYIIITNIVIWKTSPLSAWSEKYAKRSRGLHTEKLALYGRQILEVMLKLLQHILAIQIVKIV